MKQYPLICHYHMIYPINNLKKYHPVGERSHIISKEDGWQERKCKELKFRLGHLGGRSKKNIKDDGIK